VLISYLIQTDVILGEETLIIYSIVACRLKAGISESERPSIARERLGNQVSCIIVWVTIKRVYVATRTYQIVTTEMKALTVEFRR
jgi:hypothetical protein